MADLNQPNVKIQYRIKENTKNGEFNDAIYYTKEEFEALDQSVVDAQVALRVTNWVKLVDEQSKIVPQEPTQEELEAQKAELERQLGEVNDKLSILTVEEIM